MYWMNADKDVDRNELGKITQVCGDYDEGVLRVEFSTGKFSIDPRWLCAADIQIGVFVQVAGDSDEVIGEVKRVDDGKEVVVEVKGEDQKYKPKKLILCDFQPEMLVFWTKADDDIPKGHLGVVLKGLNDSGRVKVKFPKGSWRFKPSEIVRAPIQPQSYVQWTSHDDDVPIGSLGEVVGDLNDEGKVKVRFAKGTWSFKPEDLFLCEFQRGAIVKSEARSGYLGQVVGLNLEESGFRVHFMNGTFNFKMNDMELYRIQPGSSDGALRFQGLLGFFWVIWALGLFGVEGLMLLGSLVCSCWRSKSSQAITSTGISTIRTFRKAIGQLHKKP